MQLIQIGEIRQQTILEFIQQMAAAQQAEIEVLKRRAEKRPSRRRVTCSVRRPDQPVRS